MPPETVMVPMRDGVRLATDLHRPAVAAPVPVILERTPYGRHLPSRSEITAADPSPASRAALAAPFLAAGYAVVYQDTRGRYGSEGTFVKYLADGEDGADTCAWLRAQPWCDGRIATMGLSYAAHTQAALGCLDPPGLVAQVLDCGGFADAWRSGIRQSGAFELKQVSWALSQRDRLAGGRGRSRHARGPGSRGHPRLVRPPALARRPFGPAPPSRYEPISWNNGARRGRSVLGPARHPHGRLVRSLQPRGDGASVLLVRSLRAHRARPTIRAAPRRPGRRSG